MNVTHVSDQDIPEPSKDKDRLTLIFERQRSLMSKYHLIEEKNGFYVPRGIPVNLDDRFDQNHLKNFAWRVTEELTEATMALQSHAGSLETAQLHYLEEVSDAYHFLVELMIHVGFTDWDTFHSTMRIAGWGHADPVCRLDYLFYKCNVMAPQQSWYGVIEALGTAMNCLKNKPWKQTHMFTDKNQFSEHLSRAHLRFIECIARDMTADQFYRLYYKKSEVNKFRQRSAY